MSSQPCLPCLHALLIVYLVVQTSKSVDALNTMVLQINDKLGKLEASLGAINTPIQASVYQFVVAAQQQQQRQQATQSTATGAE